MAFSFEQIIVVSRQQFSHNVTNPMTWALPRVHNQQCFFWHTKTVSKASAPASWHGTTPPFLCWRKYDELGILILSRTSSPITTLFGIRFLSPCAGPIDVNKHTTRVDYKSWFKPPQFHTEAIFRSFIAMWCSRCADLAWAGPAHRLLVRYKIS
jgi:hypothetical protein